MRSLSRLLGFLAVLGLLLAPAARPASAAMVQDDIAASAMAAGMEAGDMPCCPDEAPAKTCAKDCPLMALCAAIGVQFLATAPGLNVPMMLTSAFTTDRSAELRGLAQRPPPKPPKA